MDACRIGAGQRFRRPFDIGIQGPGQATDRAVLDGVGDGLHRRKIAGAGDGEAGFDHVDLQALERLGDAQFLLAGHGRTGTLLTVAQGGIENDDALTAAHVGTSQLKPEPGARCSGRHMPRIVAGNVPMGKHPFPIGACGSQFEGKMYRSPRNWTFPLVW